MNYYNDIKNELIDIEIYKKVNNYNQNKYELQKYYNIGKLLVEAQGGESRAKYGDNLIKQYARKLTQDLGKGYTFTSLSRIRKYYIIAKKVATVSQLSWSHYVELLKFNDINAIKYYINISSIQKLSVRQLREKIKNKDYERLDEESKNKLINQKENEIQDYIKHPILIKNTYNTEEISEKLLKQLILTNIEDFLEELGTGFSFIKSEYKIKLGNNYNYIDLLLFNYIYNCFIVIELKITELKKEHIGQIQTYMNYVDKNIKSIYQDKTIGIIIVKKDNKFIMEYCSDQRIYRTTYKLI